MKNNAFLFPARFARRVPDPVFNNQLGMERHFLFVPVSKVPAGLPMDPNARVPNIRRTVYKEVRESLVTDDGMFHLKHKGITLVAASVQKRPDKAHSEYLVTLEDGHGIVDGGHTYELIMREQTGNELPEEQYVKFEVLTNVEPAMIPDIAGGLNTSVQVQDMSLDNLSGDFDWLKKIIAGEPYAKHIAWRENEQSEFDGRDLVSLLTCFNVERFPNNVSDTQPVMAYEKKSSALKLFEDDPESFKRLSPIVKDILLLHDIISAEARMKWNEDGGLFGALAFVEKSKRGFVMFFSGQTVDNRLMSGALYPILAAFRWMVEEDKKSKKFVWRGGFKAVRALWDQSALELLKMTKQASDELGRNPNAIGKSRNHWANLFARVAMRDLITSQLSKSS
ncbi:MAG: AIPR family protein [Acidobacteriota bacterium]